MNLKESNLTIVLEVDADGNIINSLQGDNGRILQISETQKVGDNLFFASPYNMYLGHLDLSPPSMEVEGKGVRMKIEREESSDDKASDQRMTDGDEEDSQHKTESKVEEESKEKKVHEEVKSDATKEEL